jgi:hypothetical protein
VHVSNEKFPKTKAFEKQGINGGTTMNEVGVREVGANGVSASDGWSLKRYILLGSFMGALVGTTASLLIFSRTSEERREIVKQMQDDLFAPVKAKFAEVVDNVGNALMETVEEAGRKAREG